MKILLLLLLFMTSLSFSIEIPKHFRPDAISIINFLTPKLNLNVKQEEKIKNEILKETETYDSLNKDLMKQKEKIKKLQEKADEIELKMSHIYQNIPNLVIPFLDDAQKEKFESLTKTSKKTKEKVKEKTKESKEEKKITEEKKIEEPKEIDIFFP